METTMSKEEELMLIEQARGGDRAAFDVLFKEYYARVAKLCTRIVGNYDDAQDCAQETFIKAWKNIDRFSGNSALYTWLYRIAVNTCRDALVARNKLSSHVTLEELSDGYGDNYDADIPAGMVVYDNPESILEGEELHKAILDAFSELPEDMRQTLYLHEVNRHTYEGVGDIVGAAANAVRVRLFRARAKLQDIMDRVYGNVAVKRKNVQS